VELDKDKTIGNDLKWHDLLLLLNIENNDYTILKKYIFIYLPRTVKLYFSLSKIFCSVENYGKTNINKPNKPVFVFDEESNISVLAR